MYWPSCVQESRPSNTNHLYQLTFTEQVKTVQISETLPQILYSPLEMNKPIEILDLWNKQTNLYFCFRLSQWSIKQYQTLDCSFMVHYGTGQ